MNYVQDWDWSRVIPYFPTLFSAIGIAISAAVLWLHRRDRSQDRRPQLVPYFAIEGDEIVVKIANVGPTPAKSIVVMTLAPTMNSAGEVPWSGSWNPQTLAGGESAMTYFDLNNRYFGFRYISGELLMNMPLHVSYEDLEGKKYRNEEWTILTTHLSSFQFGCGAKVNNPSDEILDQAIAEDDTDKIVRRSNEIVQEQLKQKYDSFPHDENEWERIQLAGWRVFTESSGSGARLIAVARNGIALPSVVSADYRAMEVAHSVLFARAALATKRRGGSVTYTSYYNGEKRSFRVR